MAAGHCAMPRRPVSTRLPSPIPRRTSRLDECRANEHINAA
ncbi:hypothetical protein HMPREF0591_0226 [Mycobacterium parascrofulaceum ATCC BAA-614]|uniref:Uncharacterized protein n=1 Tax=Mycobacterium parascrofulaceum ATCC BAA-614 TaxID=525368 RepID=D5P232_9MYCO|nr:hypothetical protein HMPREF0591_0226 [Mycobacterium parascrofulaceum ATCC BAA-614]